MTDEIRQFLQISIIYKINEENCKEQTAEKPENVETNENAEQSETNAATE